MDLISFIASWAGKNLNGPMAVLLIVSNAWWIWFVLRLRKEGKATTKEFVEALVKKEEAINNEKDARREEALTLQSKGYESIQALTLLIEKVENALTRIDQVIASYLKAR